MWLQLSLPVFHLTERSINEMVILFRPIQSGHSRRQVPVPEEAYKFVDVEPLYILPLPERGNPYILDYLPKRKGPHWHRNWDTSSNESGSKLSSPTTPPPPHPDSRKERIEGRKERDTVYKEKGLQRCRLGTVPVTPNVSSVTHEQGNNQYRRRTGVKLFRGPLWVHL